jgi:energy-coupling factor transport system ATP-binding protein
VASLISIKDLTFSYERAESPQLNRVNLEFAPGEFVLVCGPTGSGKSTLLKAINGLAPHFTGGKLRGRITIDNQDVTGRLPHELAELVGYVNQQPEGWFVADTVEDELVYGLEQLGFDRERMANELSRVAKMLGLQDLLDRPLNFLSGGQQQRVAIGAALAAGQQVLLLDEPTSALDLEAAAETVDLLKSLAKDHGVTILVAEHRFNNLLEKVDSVVVVNNDGTVEKGDSHWKFEEDLRPGLHHLDQTSNSGESAGEQIALTTSSLTVKYGDQIAVSNATLNIKAGEIVSLQGANGSGKTSLLWAMQGAGNGSKAVSTGTVSVGEFGDPRDLQPRERLKAITMVPQRAADLLFLTSLSEELSESDRFAEVPPNSTANIFAHLAGKVNPALHPRDLSSGQQLALVLALQLVKGANVLLLDEPTRGLDYVAKKHLASQLRSLKNQGKAILLATHDFEFAAQVADRQLHLVEGVIQ